MSEYKRFGELVWTRLYQIVQSGFSPSPQAERGYGRGGRCVWPHPHPSPPPPLPTCGEGVRIESESKESEICDSTLKSGGAHLMKLGQFKKRDSVAQRLGFAFGEKIVDVAALAQAVRTAGEEVAEWLLEANATLDVIARGESALADINDLFEAAHAPGLGGERHDGQRGTWCRERRGFREACALEDRSVELRLGGQRLTGAPRGRDVRCPRRRQNKSCALQRRRAGIDRCPRGTIAISDYVTAGRHAARERRPPEGISYNRFQARSADPRIADSR